MSEHYEDLLGLNRPEYAGSGEGILSALAWSLVSNAEQYDANVFEFAQNGSPRKKKFKVIETRVNDATQVAQSANANRIVFPELNGLDVAFLDAFRGVLPAKALSFPAVPLVANAALLQNPQGFKGKKNPANYAAIVEQLYCLGAGEKVATNAAASRWYSSLARQEDIRVLRCLNGLAEKCGPTTSGGKVTKPVVAPVPSKSLRLAPDWIRGYRNTPFQWFYRSWNSFCDPTWLDVLPRRRWADWATCLLRTALGTCYLWEARFYRELAKTLAGRQTMDSFNGNMELLAWPGREAKVSARDVNTRIRQDIAIGDQVRKEISDLLAESPETRPSLDQASLQEIVSYLESRLKLRETNPFALMLSEEVKGEAPNTRETVVYSLQCRAETGVDADYYSLLARRSRRYLVVEPGPEWIVVIASMVAGAPGQPTTLHHIRRELECLGLRPNRTVLVAELERAGLARNSHDADEALEVIAAFEGGLQ